MTYATTCEDKNLPRGNSRRYRLTVTAIDTGDRVDLTGSTIVFEMKRRPEQRRLQPTDPVVVTKTSDNANEVEFLDQGVEETKGQCLIKLLPADTEWLDPVAYDYSADLIAADGGRYTVAQGRIFLQGPPTASENQTPPN